MAAPNIVNVVSVVGKTQVTLLGINSVAPTTIISATANTLVKINSTTVVNTGAFSADVSFNIFRSVSLPLASGINVPEKSNLVISGRDTAIYLEELDTLQGFSSSSTVYAAVVYEIIS